MRIFTIVLGLAFGGLFFSGCATVLSGTTQTVTFESQPKGAEVRVDDRLIGATPTSITLRKGQSKTVSFSKSGYQTIERELSRRFDGLAVISTIFWDLGTTDAATGAMWQYDPDSFYVQMVAEQKSEDSDEADAERRKEAEASHRLARLILNNYPELSGDLQRGEGEYLDAVLKELERSEEFSPVSVSTMQSLHEESTRPVDFMNRLLAEAEK